MPCSMRSRRAPNSAGIAGLMRATLNDAAERAGERLAHRDDSDHEKQGVAEILDAGRNVEWWIDGHGRAGFDLRDRGRVRAERMATTPPGVWIVTVLPFLVMVVTPFPSSVMSTP